jgi:hypothetical protein
LKLKCDQLLSSFAFNLNLRRYTMVVRGDRLFTGSLAGAYTRSHFSST